MELNTQTKPTFKKHYKNKSATGIISNSQSINPSINFTWGAPVGQIQGQVLRRKSKTAPQAKSVPPKDNQKSSNKNKLSNNQYSGTNNDDSDGNQHNFKNSYEDSELSSGFIKRKHKKDKQKSLLHKDDESAPSVAKNEMPNKTYSLFSEKTKDVYVKARHGKSISEKVFTESGNKFSDLSIHKYLVSNLEKHQLVALTTVQEKAIPVILSGTDVLIRSQTGSGKTLAYAVPIIDALLSIIPRIQRKDGVQALVVVPTRELALQTHEWFSKINTFQWIVTGHLCGGENRKTEKDRLRKGIHVLIGTPGRLLDHVLHTSALKINNVRCLVLDEADRLLDMGFRKDIISLVEALDKAKTNSEYDPMQILRKNQNTKNTLSDGEEDEEAKSSAPEEDSTFPLRDINNKNRQTMLLSATLNKGVSELAEFTMKNHTFIDALDTTGTKLINDNIQNNSLVIPDTVKQEFILTYVKHRLFTLSALIVAKIKNNSKLFVFMASTQMVEFHYELFTQCLVKMPVNRGKVKTGNVVLFDADNDGVIEEEEAEEEEVVLNTKFFKLHGSMDQKMRKEVFTEFRTAKTGVLLCTDVAARGLDIPTADCIVQYTGPQTDEDYLHRVGRTGRAGQRGSAIIFLTHEEQEYISRLGEQRVFLKQQNSEEFLNHLCTIMDEPGYEQAAEALQRRYETAIAKNKQLHMSACLAYSTWSRFYNSYPAKMRTVFDFKKINLGHYATSFALRETPSQIARIVRGQVANVESPRLNKKLANHTTEETAVSSKKKPKQKRSIALLTSEYSSGLEPVKKKKKKQQEDIE